MNPQDQHVIINIQGGWSVKAGGAQRSSRRFKTQDDAVSYARRVASDHQGDLYLHRADGSVYEKLSF